MWAVFNHCDSKLLWGLRLRLSTAIQNFRVVGFERKLHLNSAVFGTLGSCKV